METQKKTENKRRIGKRYEEMAAAVLREKGYVLRETNFCCRCGEIDIIAEENGTLVFVEIKYRSRGGQGVPEESVGPSKQRRISLAAACYLARHAKTLEVPCRFDVIAIEGSTLRHHENAFPYAL